MIVLDNFDEYLKFLLICQELWWCSTNLTLKLFIVGEFAMDILKQFKKIKKLNRKGKLINKGDDEGEDAEKKAVISSLMIKCDKPRDEVREAYEEFHLKYKDGVINNDDYINSMPAKVESIKLTF